MTRKQRNFVKRESEWVVKRKNCVEIVDALELMIDSKWHRLFKTEAMLSGLRLTEDIIDALVKTSKWHIGVKHNNEYDVMKWAFSDLYNVHIMDDSMGFVGASKTIARRVDFATAKSIARHYYKKFRQIDIENDCDCGMSVCYEATMDDSESFEHALMDSCFWVTI